jgi:hypothetical protein
MMQSAIAVGQLARRSISHAFDTKIARPANVPNRHMK